ncbi:hypothetical protein B0H21DRAFT_777121 [Amylocystis lapponica]|nr:hypothetical protein B0H21DRAFT_777121 [Amylocystis lapponica]
MEWRVSALLPELCQPDSLPSLSTSRSGSHVSFLETGVGPATLTLVCQLRSHAQDAETPSTAWEGCAQLLDGALQVAAQEDVDEDGCEVLYGRAGLLYALLYLRSELASAGAARGRDAIAQLCGDANVQALVDDIVARGELGAESYRGELEGDERRVAPPLMWSWHGKRYLGAAHGVAGILQMLLSAPTRALRPHWAAVLGTIEWLLAIQEPLGNWPSKATRHMYYTAGGSAMSKQAKRESVGRDGDRDELVQWCHGAPGVLILLSTLLRCISQSESLPTTPSLAKSTRAALARGGEFVYTHGLLRKGVWLCHGVAGCVFALLAVSDALDDGATQGYWLVRTVHLAQLATSYRLLEKRGAMHTPDRPYSLYEGVGGMCCAWTEVLTRLQTSRGQGQELRGRGMPGYDDLGLLK